MLIIPLVDTPAQTLNVSLANQFCTLTVYTKSTGVFLDLYVQHALIKGGTLCEDRNRLVRSSYLGFAGDLMFVDQQGFSDPATPGLGARYLLYYLSLEDLAELA